MIALLLTAIFWPPHTPRPILWVCNPSKTPASAPSNCERVRYRLTWLSDLSPPA